MSPVPLLSGHSRAFSAVWTVAPAGHPTARKILHHHCRLYAVITDVQRQTRPVPLSDLPLQRRAICPNSKRALASLRA